jgi:uncharacterized phage protein (TIGR02220 family)
VIYLKIKNWDHWQSYRNDRGQPPWIKVHRRLLRSVKWQSLTDEEKGHLTSIWMLAADRGGEVPSDPKIIQKFCGLQSEPDLQRLVDVGFIEPGANVTPTRRQPDANVTPQIRSESESEKKQNIHARRADAMAVLEYLNTVTGRRLGYTKTIEACFKRERCTVEDCKLVIDYKYREWAGTEFVKFVNAETPWLAKNFQKYLDEAKAGPGNADVTSEAAAEARMARLREKYGEAI